ncbi:nucleoid-associated protein [Bacillus gobiensis]|uniref:nucleoid-associated protein n=1 Tax=Bacillus gobiensis TaxID=1441095 RepID=UPI003D196E57
MINIECLFIEKAIIHRLDNSDYPSGKSLSDLELELDEDLRNVITEHTKNGIKDKRRRYAYFKDRESNPVCSASNSIKAELDKFIHNSKRIANLLYLQMGNKNISAADLVVCYLRDDLNYFIGILKLDYKNQYISQIEDTKHGKRITIRKEEKGWPELGQRIQKASFIKLDPLAKDENYNDGDESGNEDPEEYNDRSPELIILDRQKSSNDDGEISLFFKDSFLNVELIADERSNTVGFVRGLKDFLANSKIDYEKKRNIYDTGLNIISTNERVDLDSFISQHFDIEESVEDLAQSEELKGYLEKNGLTRGYFDVSQEVSRKFKEKSVIELEGITLEITNDLIEDSDKVEINYNTDENTGTVTANILIKDVPIKK